MELRKKDVWDFTVKPFASLEKQWMLIAAGSRGEFNFMTAAWGGFGVLWNRPVTYIFVRPTRHTYGFLEKHDRYSLSFFQERHRKALNIAGTRSGRDIDKLKACGFTAAYPDNTPSFNEASLIMTNRKIYFQDIDPGHFLDSAIADNYSLKDYHRMYIGEIISIYS
mgnify:CR=1 FL=1